MTVLASPQAKLLTLNALGYKFYLEIEGVLAGEFIGMSGLTITREVKEVVEGGTNDFTYKLGGHVKFENIVLKKGIGYDRDLWNWFSVGLYDGKVKRKNISIILGNGEHKRAKQWDVYHAYPVKWSGPELDAKTSDVAIETLELAHHGFTLSAEESNPM